MTESNFISESDFEKLLDSIPNQSNGNTLLMKKDYQMLFKVIYGSALRITEPTTLMPKNFDLDNKILTLPQTKTGWKHCKCSKWDYADKSHRSKELVSADKTCIKCEGTGWNRVQQKTTIDPRQIKELREYLKDKKPGVPVWPIHRRTIWWMFKKMCDNADLHYKFIKKEAIFYDNPYLLRSSRAKIMELMQAPPSYIKLKLRHTFSNDVTFAYTVPDINQLLAWESKHYTKELIILD